MKTAKYKSSCIILFLFLFYSCEKFDYTADENDKQYLNSYSELEQAVTGAYAKFASIFADDTWRNSFLIQNINADDIDYYSTTGCSGDSCRDNYQTINENNDTIFLNYGCNRGNTKDYKDWNMNIINNSYRNMYKAIGSQNYIITQFIDRVIPDESSARLLGEVYYMRAYTYFRFTRLFGNIPLITDIEVDYDIQRASFTEICRQIESDLKHAIILLPQITNSTKVKTICPNRGCAKALLAEVYLTVGGFPIHDHSKYGLAAQYAREVIDSASIYGFGLVDDFADLYTWKFKTNKEMVSVVQYKSEFGLEDLSQYYVPFNSNELSFLDIEPLAEVKFYNRFPLSYRKELTFNNGHEIGPYFDTTTYELWYDTIYPLKTTSCYRLPIKKSSAGSKYSWEYFQKKESYSIYILRFAHTLLTYAEASASSGNIDALSYEAVNQVRRRANKLTINTPSKFDLIEGLTPNEFIDSVVWERAWEFTGEAEGRWFDLLRLEMIDHLDELRDPQEAPIPLDLFQIGSFFFSIPEDDIYLNPNLDDD